MIKKTRTEVYFTLLMLGSDAVQLINQDHQFMQDKGSPWEVYNPGIDLESLQENKTGSNQRAGRPRPGLTSLNG